MINVFHKSDPVDLTLLTLAYLLWDVVQVSKLQVLSLFHKKFDAGK